MGTKMIPRTVRKERGVHMLATEAQNLDEVLQILKERHRHEAQSKTMKERHHQPHTLHAISVMAQNQAKFRAYVQKQTAARKAEKHPPHPYRDIPEDQKPAKMREMYYSHAFGFGVKAHRDLSCMFAVSYDQAVEWIGDKANSVYPEDENYRELQYEARERYDRLQRYRNRSANPK